MECGSRPSTVRHAATIACPITCPPNTRCQLVFGLLPRNRFTSSGSISRMEIRSIRPLDMEAPLLGRIVRNIDGRHSGMRLLAQALALRQGLGADIAIIVADPALAGRPSRDPRATAIVAACRRLFEAIGVWDQVAGNAQPILDMVVTDSRLQDATRPVFLTFAGDVEPGEPFAHMIENRHLIDALVTRTEAEGIDLRATAVSTFDSRSDGVDVTLADGSAVEASLLVAADGARSRLRERAGIATRGWDYDQSGIVVTVGHERDHEGRAEEHFLPAGPFAILPLTGKRSSLVWTERRAEAARIVALSDDEFHRELEQRFGLHLGEIKTLDRPRAFPLGYFVARSFIGERLALVGDAAHVIHPIAGQGLK